MPNRFRAAAFLIGVGWIGLSSAAPAPPKLPGDWKLTFDEEFDGPLSSSRWKQSLWGMASFSGEQEQYSSTAVSVSSGVLSLTASRQSLGGHDYVSGLIDTGPILGQQPTGYSFRYGYVEARMKLVSGRGLWPAFWMLPDPNPSGAYHDGDGEIDIMEEIGSEPTVDQIHLHQHGSQWGKGVATATDLSKGFHDYAVNWQPGKLDFYLDGKLVYTVNAAPSVAEYLILNLAVGADGSWPGAPDATTALPSTMQVDFVHVFQQAAVPEPVAACAVIGVLVSVLARRHARRH